MGNIVIPGQKLCPKCKEQFRNHLQNQDDKPDVYELSSENQPDTESENADYNQSFTVSNSRGTLNATLGELKLSPFKVHSLPKCPKIIHGKRKLEQVYQVVQQKIASTFTVEPSVLSASNSGDQNVCKTKANDLDYLVNCMKEKMKLSNRNEKLQILRLIPKSWSIRKAAEEFGVSKSTIQKAKLLRDTKGIMTLPEFYSHSKISEELINSITSFYCDDEYSRQLPGKKDYVSIGKNQHMSKRLLLCNLKELYSCFKLNYPDEKVSFFKFASLRPKWCIIAGPKNTHAVCVYSYHQNIKLLLSSIGIEHLSYEIIDMIVCNRDSKECIVHRCNKCPGIEKAYKFIQNILNGDVEDDLDFDISFMQWVTTDRSNLITKTLSADDFLSFLCEKLDSITAHSS